MTVLDLDPPQPTLRLVSSSGAGATRNHRYREAAPLHGEARDLYRNVLEAALAWQARIDPDALRVVLATKQASSGSHARAFSAPSVWQLMFIDIVSWCKNRQLDVPRGCATALLRTIEYLDVTDSFDEHSDSAASLYDALDECTGGWADEIYPATSSTVPTTPSPTRTRGSLRSERGKKRT